MAFYAPPQRKHPGYVAFYETVVKPDNQPIRNMYKIVALFVLILSVLQVLLSEFQYYILHDNSNVLTAAMFLSELIIVLIACLLFLRFKNYKLNYFKSLLVSLIIIIPFPFLTSIYWSIKNNTSLIQTLTLENLFNIYLLPFLCALVISAFVRERKKVIKQD